MKRELYEQARQKALEMYEKAHIVLTPREKENLEVADLGLGDLWNTGLEIVTYVNTERCCAKEMVLFHIRPARSIAMRRCQATPGRRKPSAAGMARFICMWKESLPTRLWRNRPQAAKRITRCGTRSCCGREINIP